MRTGDFSFAHPGLLSAGLYKNNPALAFILSQKFVLPRLFIKDGFVCGENLWMLPIPAQGKD